MAQCDNRSSTVIPKESSQCDLEKFQEILETLFQFAMAMEPSSKMTD